MITLDTNALIGLAANETLVKEFPFIADARKVTTTGGCCGRKTVTGPAANMNAIKMQIAFLPLEGQQKFKQITGWNRVRVVFESGSGTRTVIF
jgi:hypothetical protein